MVQDLLSFTKVSDESIVTPSPTDSSEVLREVIQSLAVLIERGRGDDHIRQTSGRQHAADTPEAASAELNQQRFEIQAARRKHHRQGFGDKGGREWMFDISDNGIGFDPIYAQRIFGVFKRLHGRNEYPGSGIGLAICSRIVSLYGGRIWAEGRPGAGATFFFTAAGARQSGEH